ncbi:52 kDa repressor of the inhibitor of the protein kinase [Eublepharis macularius]|uniref:52 kDa repressor of the inhibitor of the protein kinase n=1 Tax=Eublepharis macularius TaxID=481883 RepID=A0AA97J2K3_EUBMA|nr:52 kDa repressor of the inhibitor of the protein kinase [Eublepharis macularius]
MPNFCAAPNCTRKSTQSDLAFFRFPRDPARCQRWVENCRRADLEDKTPDQLNKHYRLCAKHFEASMICRSSPYRTVLRDNAVPTIFDLTSHLNNPHSRHRKRIKELSEEEIRTLKQQKVDEAYEQEKTNPESTDELQNPASEEGGDEHMKDDVPLTQEERENKDYLKSLFEILILMGRQNIPLDGHGADELPEGIFTPDNFQALLEFRINSGDEVLRKRFETTAVNLSYCSQAQQKQMLEICESCIREETLREVRDSHFFSIVTEEVVDLAGENHLPVLVRFVDDSHNLREEFVGFLPYEADPDILAVKFHTTIIEKWGLNMEYCRGQAYIVSSGLASKMKTVATRILEKYPQAVYTLSSSCALNIWLAKSVPVLGISIALGTIEAVCTFFHQSQVLSDLDNVISLLFQNSEDRGKELKEVIRSHWTCRHDTFEIIVDLMQALVLCLDGINESSARWNTMIAGRAYILSSALADFDFVVTVVIVKNILSFTRAFGKNLQGQTSDVFFAASSLTAVLHSLNEVMENIEVYHEFWFEEATSLATKLDLPVKVPGKFCRAQQGNLDSEVTPENYYKEALSIPTVEHIIQELKDIFSEQHLRALKCLSLVPSVMGQLKFNTSEEHHADMYKNDLPNPDTLSAELHCWRIKWKHRGKDIELPTSIYEALHLPDIKFFPNVYALLKVLCILPLMKVENEKFEVGRRRLKAYLKNTLTEQRSGNLALLNINFDIKHDLDLMVDTYIKLYPDKAEFQEEFLSSNSSEIKEET